MTSGERTLLYGRFLTQSGECNAFYALKYKRTVSIQPQAQVDRIKRTEVIADDLVFVQVETEGGFQKMPTLVLNHSTFGNSKASVAIDDV